MGQSWDVRFTEVDDKQDQVRSINMGWENRSEAEVMANLNAFLIAIGMSLEVVGKKK